jgi:hypothetical protein
MSKHYRFVALVNAKDGQDDEFNAWHSGRHLPEVVRAAGFTRGERLRLVNGSSGGNTVYRYLVLFEGEGDPVMPTQVSAGVNGPVMALAWHAASIVRMGNGI